jgi:SpoVK/Ycf46/Vps4 family AAA+-type ATPase
MKLPWSSTSDEDKLNDRLASEPEQDRQDHRSNKAAQEMATPSPTSVSGSLAQGTDYCQWSSGPNETFRPSGPRREILPSGIYRVDADQMGPFFVRTKVVTDNLIELDDAATTRVLGSIRTFWKSREEYVKRGVLYKRGLLLWGPAGSGKTATLALLMRDLLRMDGLVFICQNPEVLSVMLAVLRRIEPVRNVIVVLEDIDELVARFGEHDILALLDGESQIDNVVNIATTNYPERLGARIINRPSRFDERILVDMPNAGARAKYLQHITQNESMSDEMLHEWIRKTEGFSVAHLRELVVAVFCLKQPFEEVLERLLKMQYQPRALKEFSRAPMGLAGGQPMQAGFAAQAAERG